MAMNWGMSKGMGMGWGGDGPWAELRDFSSLLVFFCNFIWTNLLNIHGYRTDPCAKCVDGDKDTKYRSSVI